MKSHSITRKWTLSSIAFALLAGSFAMGCASMRIQTPSGFAQLPDQQPNYHYRSMSADGVVLAARTHANRMQGNLAFWSATIDRTLQSEGRYRPIAHSDVRTAAGLAGHRFEYVLGEGPTSHRYQVHVFVTPDRVFVIEAGGADGAFEHARADIERAVRSLSPG